MTEYFAKRFGTNPGYFYTGLSIALAGSVFFYLLLQIQGTGIVLSTIFSLPMSVSILIVVVVLIISLDASGMWSVVASDTFSCLIFIVVAVFVLPITISSVGGLETGIAAVNSHNLWSATGASKLNMTYFLGYALSWLAIVGGSPHIINRSLIVDEPKSVLKGTFVGYILTIILTVVLFLSGCLLVAKIAPKAMPVDSITPYAALNVWPLWLGVLIITGAIAAAWTTANTQAMTIAQSIVDFYRFSVNKAATDKKLLNVTRLAAVIVLIVTGLVAMKKFWILAIASSLAGIIFSLGFFPVLVLSLYWGKVTRTATNIMLWASLPIGAFLIVTNYLYGWFAPFPTIYSFPIGFGGLILLSYLTKPSQEEQDAFRKLQDIAFGSSGEKIVAAKSDYITFGLGISVIIIVAVILIATFS